MSHVMCPWLAAGDWGSGLHVTVKSLACGKLGRVDPKPTVRPKKQDMFVRSVTESALQICMLNTTAAC